MRIIKGIDGFAHVLHMCYFSHMPRAAVRKPELATSRLVILLRKSERLHVEKLAAAENVSAAEIVRRSLDTYQSIEARLRKEHEEELMKSAVAMLDGVLAAVNESIEQTCAKLDVLHLELQKRELA